MNTSFERTPQKKPAKSRAVYETLDWVEIFLSALVTVILIFTFFFRLVVVNGESMTNTLQPEDHLGISTLFYTPSRGDIVVLQVPSYEDGKKPLIKRVIATGGEWVDIDFDTWQVYVGSSPETLEPIDEPYVRYLDGEQMRYAYTKEQYPMQIRPGHLFVMGDNRNGSLDSRDSIIGQINENYVMGHVLLRLFPLDTFGTV